MSKKVKRMVFTALIFGVVAVSGVWAAHTWGDSLVNQLIIAFVVTVLGVLVAPFTSN